MFRFSTPTTSSSDASSFSAPSLASFSTLISSTAIAAGVLASVLAGCDSSAPSSGRAAEGALDAHEIAISEVPIDIHRRAAQLIVDVRGSESAPTWDRAVLEPSARVLLRPDVEGPAYYEFRVVVDGEEAGHIVASAGDHDFPVSHWDYQGKSPTRELDERAGAEELTYYRADSLTYVAEDTRGEMVAILGTLPARIEGQDPGLLEDPPADTEATWVPDQATGDDEEAENLGGTLQVEGPEATGEISFSAWESWGDFKAGYRESYDTMIASLRQQAAEEWDIEATTAAHGEGLVEGQPFELALLYRGAEIDVSGEGAERVDVEVVETAPGSEILVLTGHDAEPGAEIPFDVAIQYSNGQSELVGFVLLSAKDVGSSSAAAGKENVAWADVAQKGSWSPWNQFWAGSHNDQRLYSQIPSGTSPNTSGCYSGCGGTAWAMLFGWADYRASIGDPAWSHRWGLYRYNGGYGSNAVAPKYQDGGVRNMSWEIRNRIGTWCWGSSGATFPWEMSDASGYLAGRTGATLSTDYNVAGIHRDHLRNKARDSIVDRRVPAIIGTGWLSHYPLAYGYRWRKRTVRKCFIWCWNEVEYQRQFYVNQGWGGSGNGWISAGTWFAGRLYAN